MAGWIGASLQKRSGFTARAPCTLISKSSRMIRQSRCVMADSSFSYHSLPRPLLSFFSACSSFASAFSRIDRSSCLVKEGQVISIDAAKSPAIAEIAKKGNSTIPAYMEVDLENLKATLTRAPQLEEIPVSVKIMSVIEYYAR